MKNILLFVFLLLIPTQLGRHFWPEWSMVNGIRSDYLSPILYLTDVVWMGWMMNELRIKNEELGIKRINLSRLGRLRNLSYLIITMTIIIGNIVLASNPWVAGYRWLRLGQWVMTIVLLRRNFDLVKTYLKVIIPIWIMGESLLAIAQVAKNGSLQGMFWWLGERKFDYMTIGTALMSWWGVVKVRAYGTFSHPNSLAGFLLVSMVVWEKIKLSRLGHLSNLSYLKSRIINWVVVILGIVGIILTGSRTVWITGGIVLIIKLLGKLKSLKLLRYQKRLVVGLFGLVFIAGGVIYLNSSGWDSESYTKRIELNKAAIEMVKTNPLLGVGAGNFVVDLANIQKNGILWLQPVHNIILLGLSEVGILGLIMFYKLLKSLKMLEMLKFKTRDTWMIWGVILATGMADHYWVTLPQNMWLAAIVAAII